MNKILKVKDLSYGDIFQIVNISQTDEILFPENKFKKLENRPEKRVVKNICYDVSTQSYEPIPVLKVLEPAEYCKTGQVCMIDNKLDVSLIEETESDDGGEEI